MLRTLFQMLGEHYGRTDLRDIEVIVRSILAAVPGDATALHFLGLVYYRTDRRSAAVSAFARAAHAPGAPLTIPPDAGERFLARNGYSAAAACQLEASRPSSGLAYAWYDVGVSLAELGYPHRAVSAFRSSLVSWPQFPAADRAIAAVSSHIERHGASAGEPLHLAVLDPIGGVAAPDDSSGARLR